MTKILYIHGLNSGADCRTARTLRETLPQDQFTIIAPDIPISANAALAMVKRIIEDEKIDIAVAASLGAFTALHLRGIKRVIINPSCYPADRLPSLGVEQSIAEEYRPLQERLWENITPEDERITVALFGDHDELFSYREEFSRHYKNSRVEVVDEGHRLSVESIKSALVPIILDIAKT